MGQNNYDSRRVMITGSKGNYLKWATRAVKQYSQLEFSRIFCWSHSSEYFQRANDKECIFFDLCFSGPENIVENCFNDLRRNVATIV